MKWHKVEGGKDEKDENALSSVQQSQEFLASLSTRSHAAQHAAGGRGAASLLDATHDHAKVGGFHNNPDTTWLENFRDCQSNLLGQALLNLKSAGEHLSQASKLRESEDTAIRDIADVHLPHMVSVIRWGIYAGSILPCQ